MGQTASQEIPLSNINYAQIESLFYQKINALRAEKGFGKLFSDDVLKLAAKDQAAYMHATLKVGHDQKIKGKETPHKRVEFYKGTHDMVGENCIQIFLKKPMKTKYARELVIAKTYEEAAQALFLGWKNSPRHYKNMIAPGYDVSGLGFYFSADSSSLYCAQVFSAKPYIQHKGLESPLDSYGIKPTNQKVCDCFNSDEYAKLVGNLHLIYGGDSLYISSEDFPALKRFFSKPTDGIYFDVVLREQFVCANNNLLHGSEVYDGTMLKPVYFKDIFKKNQAFGDKNFYATLCAIPKIFDAYTHEINYGFVKENFSCTYVWPINVPGENLKVLQLYPKWMELENEKIPVDTFNGELTFNIQFERGKTQLSEKQQQQLNKKLQIYKPFIKEVSIKTFSSVEGSTQINMKLQAQRAEIIKNEIIKTTGKLSGVEIESKENWEEFYKQIENGKFAYMKTLSQEQIKEALKNRIVLDSIDYLLRKTRIAKITIQLEAIVNDQSDPQLVLGAYKKAVASGDSLRSFKYQNKLLQSVFRNQISNADITQVSLPFDKKFLPHWTNFIALATFDPELIYTHETRQMALKAMNVDTTFAPLQFNMCIMTLKFMSDYMDTLMPVKQLEKKMSASYLMKNKADSSLVRKMWLNYHIISAYHHWLRHEYDKINPSLTYIKNYFEKQQITETEALKLGLLFNFYGRYSWTLDMLHPFVNETKNEDLLFLYVKTYAGNRNETGGNAEWQKYLTKAKNMNIQRFYNWIDKDNFQLMRLPEIKKEFCTINKNDVR
ncbi:MAG: CAP domain-containing protein [Bacteroidetes bacterium]|nr:CAP domain-containing protein [Bacteroidota bacterium]